jgi:hypothetical protein
MMEEGDLLLETGYQAWIDNHNYDDPRMLLTLGHMARNITNTQDPPMLA